MLYFRAKGRGLTLGPLRDQADFCRNGSTMVVTYGYGFDLECPYCYRKMVVEGFSDGTNKVSHAGVVCAESRAYALDLGEHEVDRFLSNGEAERMKRRTGGFLRPLLCLCFAVHPPTARGVDVNYPLYLRKGMRAAFGVPKSNVVLSGIATMTDFAIDGKVYLPGAVDLAHLDSGQVDPIEPEGLSYLTCEAVARGLGRDQSERIARVSFRLFFTGGHPVETSLIGNKGICVWADGEYR